MMNSPLQPWKGLSATLHVGALTEGWNLHQPPAKGSEDERVFRSSIYFSIPFEAPPIVHLALTGFDLDQRDSARLSTRVVEITASGFVAEIVTWRETRVYAAELSWLALGP
jgi:hypothetical protein